MPDPRVPTDKPERCPTCETENPELRPLLMYPVITVHGDPGGLMPSPCRDPFHDAKEVRDAT